VIDSTGKVTDGYCVVTAVPIGIVSKSMISPSANVIGIDIAIANMSDRLSMIILFRCSSGAKMPPRYH